MISAGLQSSDLTQHHLPLRTDRLNDCDPPIHHGHQVELAEYQVAQRQIVKKLQAYAEILLT